MKAISVPGRIWAKIFALEEVLVKRGSTLISLAPLSVIAFVTHLKEMGWFSAALLPIIIMQSAFLISIQ